MKILLDGIIFSLQQYGGISVYFMQLLQLISKTQGEAILLLDKNLKQKIPKLGNNIEIIQQSHRLLERYRRCNALRSNIVFHSSYYRLPRPHHLSTVVTVHDFIYERFQKGPRRWIHSIQKNTAIQTAKNIICVSETTKQDLLEFIGIKPEQNIFVIHNGVSNAFQPLNLEKSLKQPFILFVGRRDGYKNFKVVRDSLNFLPKINLYCIGGGPLELKELEGLPDSILKRIKHFGFVSDKELNILYNRAVCLVYPSSYEGFGIPVIEAMRAGCPVISTNCKAILEVGRDALTVVSELDPHAIAEAIIFTVSSNRTNIIHKGLSVSQDYSWENTHLQTLEVYRSMGVVFP